MLSKIPSSLKSPMRLVLIICTITHFTLYCLTAFANFGGNFFSVLASLILTFVTIPALAAVPVLLFLKKDKIACSIFTLLTAYWLIDYSRENISFAYAFDENNPGIYNAAVILSFVFGLGLLAAFIFVILSIFLKKDIFKAIAVLCVAGSLVFGLVAAILWMITYGKYDMGWTLFVDAINGYIVMPCVVTSGCLYLYLALERKE